MKFYSLNRKVHRWLGVLTALPLILIIGTGALLHLKKQISWIQPPVVQGSSSAPTLSFDKLLSALKTVPEFQVREWSDVHRMDVRPSRGIAKVHSKHTNLEVQVDLATGEILQAQERRSDLIESLHDGTWFSESTRWGVFFPAGIAIGALWITGLTLFLQPYLLRRRRRRSQS